eukprot:Cvel_13507.t1-p1 / transcript=Cvel_13507.t1 / gene=Cvel_13507 / organism=Chromera_velia_CCMP2878 / gene_product=hypothetical protein / transcript_product=hypothetical protein / location=Cvel_scaffold926:2802-14335(-) / protein_length=897 / sequence_SO=supercontig / SO=protein_coding / is_pseudo=false
MTTGNQNPLIGNDGIFEAVTDPAIPAGTNGRDTFGRPFRKGDQLLKCKRCGAFVVYYQTPGLETVKGKPQPSYMEAHLMVGPALRRGEQKFKDLVKDNAEWRFKMADQKMPKPRQDVFEVLFECYGIRDPNANAVWIPEDFLTQLQNFPPREKCGIQVIDLHGPAFDLVDSVLDSFLLHLNLQTKWRGGNMLPSSFHYLQTRDPTPLGYRMKNCSSRYKYANRAVIFTTKRKESEVTYTYKVIFRVCPHIMQSQIASAIIYCVPQRGKEYQKWGDRFHKDAKTFAEALRRAENQLTETLGARDVSPLWRKTDRVFIAHETNESPEHIQQQGADLQTGLQVDPPRVSPKIQPDRRLCVPPPGEKRQDFRQDLDGLVGSDTWYICLNSNTDAVSGKELGDFTRLCFAGFANGHPNAMAQAAHTSLLRSQLRGSSIVAWPDALPDPLGDYIGGTRDGTAARGTDPHEENEDDDTGPGPEPEHGRGRRRGARSGGAAAASGASRRRRGPASSSAAAAAAAAAPASAGSSFDDDDASMEPPAPPLTQDDDDTFSVAAAAAAAAPGRRGGHRAAAGVLNNDDGDEDVSLDLPFSSLSQDRGGLMQDGQPSNGYPNSGPQSFRSARHDDFIVEDTQNPPPAPAPVQATTPVQAQSSSLPAPVVATTPAQPQSTKATQSGTPTSTGSSSSPSQADQGTNTPAEKGTNTSSDGKEAPAPEGGKSAPPSSPRTSAGTPEKSPSGAGLGTQTDVADAGSEGGDPAQWGGQGDEWRSFTRADWEHIEEGLRWCESAGVTQSGGKSVYRFDFENVFTSSKRKGTEEGGKGNESPQPTPAMKPSYAVLLSKDGTSFEGQLHPVNEESINKSRLSVKVAIPDGQDKATMQVMIVAVDQNGTPVKRTPSKNLC